MSTTGILYSAEDGYNQVRILVLVKYLLCGADPIRKAPNIYIQIIAFLVNQQKILKHL